MKTFVLCALLVITVSSEAAKRTPKGTSLMRELLIKALTQQQFQEDAIKYDVNIEKLAKDIVTVIKRDPGIFDSILGAAKKAAKTYGPKIIKGVVSTLTEHVAGGNQPAAPAEVTQPPATLPPATQPPATTTEQSTTVM